MGPARAMQVPWDSAPHSISLDVPPASSAPSHSFCLNTDMLVSELLSHGSLGAPQILHELNQDINKQT